MISRPITVLYRRALSAEEIAAASAYLADYRAASRSFRDRLVATPRPRADVLVVPMAGQGARFHVTLAHLPVAGDVVLDGWPGQVVGEEESQDRLQGDQEPGGRPLGKDHCGRGWMTFWTSGSLGLIS